MWSWRLGGPQICCLLAGGLESQWCDSVWVWQPENQGSQARADEMRNWSSAVRQENKRTHSSLLPPPFVLLRSFLDGWEDAHPHGEGSLFHWVHWWSAHLILKHIYRHTQKWCLIWVPCGQLILIAYVCAICLAGWSLQLRKKWPG